MPSKSSIQQVRKTILLFHFDQGRHLIHPKMSFHHAKKVRISNNVTLNQLFVKPSFFPSKQSTLS